MTNAGPVYVDLITPENSPAPSPNHKAVAVDKENHHQIVLSDSHDSDDSDENVVVADLAIRAAGGRNGVGKRKVTGPVSDAPAECLDSDDDEVVEIPRPLRPVQVLGGAGSSNTDDAAEGGDEPQFLGRTGHSLLDFPHARENCFAHPFREDRSKICANCFCYVCDQPAASCCTWSEHCHATHTELRWQRAREEHKKHTAATSRGKATSSLPNSAAHRAAALDAPISCGAILKAVEQVYPKEAAAPAKLTAALRPYQAQSLAFMIDVEESEDPILAGTAGVRGGWLTDEMVCAGLLSNLGPHLSHPFVMEFLAPELADPRTHPSDRRVQGMGKTCVCAALILAQPTKRTLDRSAARDLGSRSGTRTHAKHDIGGTRYFATGSARDLRQPDPEMVPMKRVQEPINRFGVMRRVVWSWVRDEAKATLPNPEYSKWTPPPVVHYGFTLVVTSNALLGQWQDELKRHAPSLRVGWYYGSQKDKIYPDLAGYDVVLTTFHSSLFTGGWLQYIQFHRLIIDECHSKDAIIWHGMAADAPGHYRFAWGVTGTPLSSSVSDLQNMAAMLGQWRSVRHGRDAAMSRDFQNKLDKAPVAGHVKNSSGALCLELYQYQDADRRAELPGVLKRIMIRHSKSQRIGGEVALALPEADCETVWLDMSTPERKIYQYGATCKRLTELMADPDVKEKAKTFHVENILRERRQACAGVGTIPKGWVERGGRVKDQYAELVPTLSQQTKLQALLNDLLALRDKEPSLHAVVFTHHACAYDRIRKALQEKGFEVCGFDGTMAADKRHETIRNFQASADASKRTGAKVAKVGAKVFVATMKVGNVGVTLTAASRVYLFEPCLDPMMEVQAAGRIHRLGQTKEVLVKRFCYKNSIDGAIVKLHRELCSGKVAIVDGLFPVAALKLLGKDA